MFECKRLRLALAGVAIVATVGVLVPAEDANAARKRRGRTRGGLRVVRTSVGGLSELPHNHVIEMVFSTRVARSSVRPAIFRVRAANDDGTGFTRQVAGDFQIAGNVVRFFPRLPTHLRDPADPAGGFYREGHERDDADSNAAFQPGVNHELRILGNPNVAAVRSTRGKKLNRTFAVRFSTAESSPVEEAFTTTTYTDAPPPRFEFSNPPDRPASVVDQYARSGGAPDVPNGLAVTLFGSKVPLSPKTVRQADNVRLTLLERRGDPAARQLIDHSVFLEQNFDTTRIVLRPRNSLPDVGVYAVRISKGVQDLTETFAWTNNQERLRLREIYDFLAGARSNAPVGTPSAQLPDPPVELIFDWPQGPENLARRGVLKGNLLAMGDGRPDEIDPRVMLMFSTRDEPVSEGAVVFEFDRADGLEDAALTIASWDRDVPGAVAAISTVAGGTAEDGDYEPVLDETLSTDAFDGSTVNWRRLRIPAGVTVTLTGSRPVVLKALSIQIDGTLRVDGRAGGGANTGTFASSPTTQAATVGGAGGPGGGTGGGSGGAFPFDHVTPSVGNGGQVGVDSTGAQALPTVGGQPGGGGTMGLGTATYRMGGGGGGGGGRLAGSAGAASLAAIGGWGVGQGGAGGAGSSNDKLEVLYGGAGGGAGGNAVRTGPNWSKTAGAGGGGGGAILLQTSGILTIGSQGRITARGGVGGRGTNQVSTMTAGPGGGGGGGSILLRSTQGFNLAAPGANVDVRGGAGGTQTGTNGAPNGGAGGAGYARLEDPNGGFPLPGGTSGVYDPVGGGTPSVAYTKWVDLGVLAPRMVEFTRGSFAVNPAANDAILVETQFAVEDPNQFGSPLLDALTPSQDTNDPTQVSLFNPVRILDRTGAPGGAFGPLPDYDPGVHGSDYIWPVADKINGFGYKFVRLRVTFQLDEAQAVSDPVPFVDRVSVGFLFNL